MRPSVANRSTRPSFKLKAQKLGLDFFALDDLGAQRVVGTGELRRPCLDSFFQLCMCLKQLLFGAFPG